tara:strand:- start:745 stop:1263 length:519 start_codon:yes stop_codon:yes gene_type:complete
MERAMMTENFPSLKDAFKSVCKEFNIEPRDYLLDKLVGMWNKNWMLAQPYEETIEVLKELREKYQVVLVSNTDCFGISKVLEKFEMRDLFDKIFLSCEVHLIKTDKNFLKVVVDELNVDVKDCLMVGDSLQSDIVAAKRIEIDAVLVDRRDSRDFNPKVKDLKGLASKLEEW